MQELARDAAGLSMLRLSTPAETASSLLLGGRPGAALARALELRGVRTGRCLLLAGVTGSGAQVRQARRRAGAVVRRHAGVRTGTTLGRRWQSTRFDAPYLCDSLWARGYGVDTVETATTWSRVAGLVRRVEAALHDALDEPVHVGTHLSHVYATGSSVYTTVVFRLGTDSDDTLQRWRRLKAAGLAAVHAGGGTVSHQHGVGLDHREALVAEKGPAWHRRSRRAAANLRPGRAHEPREAPPMTALVWDAAKRERTWQALDRPWDLVVVGGGITGVGVLRGAARMGLRALLLERRDFAWGASSRSTKLVHGRLRYLAQGRWAVTREAVAERERLLREAPGLVTPLPFLLPLPRDRLVRRLVHRGAVGVYEALARRPPSRVMSSDDVARLAPLLDGQQMRGALRYVEGQTDDARLVLAVLREAVLAGACTLNDAEVTALHCTAGRVTGVEVLDHLTGRMTGVRACVVVNATGTWSDHLRSGVGGVPRMRPARGSHLLFARERFPLLSGVVVRSPRDDRPVSVFPWQGATLVGTTDVDHGGDVGAEPRITADEVTYLLECVQGPFRQLELTRADVVSTWSGLRPLLPSGARHSHDELRRHAVWDEHGLLTAAGGK